MSRDSSAMPDDNGTMCRGPAEAAVFSRGQRLALMCFLWKTCSGPKGNSHQTALFHLFLSALFLSIRVPQNSHIKWNRGLDEGLATDTNQPTSGYWSSTAWLLCFGSLPLFVWACEVNCGSFAISFSECDGLKVKQRPISVLWKVFSSFFPLSCESHSLIKSGKAWISQSQFNPKHHIKTLSNLF